MSTESHVDINQVLQMTATLESIKTIDKDLDVELLVNTTMCAPNGTGEDFEPVKESIISYLKAIQADSNKKSEVPMPEKTTEFMYTMCLDGEELQVFNARDKNVSEVVFDVSRFGTYQERLKMPGKCTIKQAVKAAEKYLSMLVTQEYFENNDDEDLEYDEVFIRGDLLGAATFLETLELENGVLTLRCGS
jgi:hypothetical protein